MNAQEFVDAIKQQAGENSISAVRKLLERPPGRSPKETLKILSKWYNESADDQKAKILEVVKQAVDMSVFSLLCVLDGVSSIENDFEKGQLLLFYEKNGQRVLLNDTKSELLHDLL